MHILVHSVCFISWCSHANQIFPKLRATYKRLSKLSVECVYLHSRTPAHDVLYEKSTSGVLKKPEKWRLLLLRIDGPKRSFFFFQFSRNICLNNTIGRAVLEAYCNFYLRTKKAWSVWTISLLSFDRVRLPSTQHKSYWWRGVSQSRNMCLK